MLEFLGWDEPDEEQFTNDVRIVLASAEFSKELTTAVLWLCDCGIDIRCVRLKPYGDKQRIPLDVQQVIPLPEAEDYQIKVREKKQAERETRRSFKDLTKFTVVVNGERFENLAKRNAMRELVKALFAAGCSPEEMQECLEWRTYFLVTFDRQDTHEELEAKMRRANHEMKRWFHAKDGVLHRGDTGGVEVAGSNPVSSTSISV